MMPRNDPVVIHHGDQATYQLVNQVLIDDNYLTRSQAMHMALEASNKHGFVDETIQIPSENSSKRVHWSLCNVRILTWILNALAPELADSVIYATFAKEVWDDPKELYPPFNKEVYLFLSIFLS
ncbi:hypothetical protein MLD38_004931 [Melastoma candidum]|uniref:Uncharacterized protein n=1 Tax=Melastoma candidum TaxID=119954 RepID=A0ACB9S7A4_9MYRT|nr:hypothetical protein MLD38_004931 [Melastoma candidum]